MLELEDALKKILAALPTPEVEHVPFREAHERVLAEGIQSSLDLPPFDNSAMDGYAVRAADVGTARPGSPVSLRLCGRVAAGENFSGEVKSGECVRLFTGSAMPRGADAVVMQEDTRTDSARQNEILICDTAKPGENVRERGSDVKRGTTLAEAGDILTPGKISLLAAAGVGTIGVGRRPRVGLLATGSELCEAGQPLAPGQIYESNRATLSALISRVGSLPEIFPLVPDTLESTQRALDEALNRCDVVVTSGGVSVGEMDFVKAAFERLGGELQFWKVAVRPGKPFVFGRCREKFLFGLPGNPVSAFVTFLLLVRPALLRWQGARQTTLPSHPGTLAEPLINHGDRRHFMRVRVNEAGKVFSAGPQTAQALFPLASADGLVDVPAKKNLAAGTVVSVLRWQ